MSTKSWKSYRLGTLTTNHNTGPSYSSQNVQILLEKGVLQSFAVPAWKSKIANLQSATSPFLAIEQEAVWQTGQMKLGYHETGHPEKWHQVSLSGPWCLGGYSPPALGAGAPSTYAQAMRNAKVDFLANLYGAQAVFSGGVFLGELRETLQMFATNLTRFKNLNSLYIQRVIDALKDAGSRRSFLRKLTELYLEYVYGWRPLVQDLEDAIKAANEVANRPKTKFILGEGSSSNLISSGEDLYNTSGIYWLRTMRQEEHTYSRFSGVMGCSLDMSAEHLRHLLGFDPERDFNPTVWELIPYSFVVDYFSNVGDYIAGSFADTTSLRWTSATSVSSSRYVLGGRVDSERNKSYYGANLDFVGGSPGSGELKAKRVQRVVPDLTLNPVGDLRFFYPKLFDQHWWNLMVLSINKALGQYERLLKRHSRGW